MSLARTLMGSGATTVDNTPVNESILDSSYMDMACESLVSDIYAVDKAYHIADIMGEIQVIKEGADGEAILENIIKDKAKKLGNSFRSFWEKVKAWFGEVKKFFLSLVLSNKKFVKEYGETLKKKETKGFWYTGYKFDVEAGDAEVQKIRDLATKISDEFPSTLESNEEFIKSKIALKGSASVSEVREELILLYHSGLKNKVSIEDIDVADMIKVVTDNKTTVDAVKKEETAFKELIDKAIKTVEDGHTEETDKDNVQKYSTLISAIANTVRQVCSVKVEVYKDMNRTYGSVLRAFLRYKPTSEAAGEDDVEVEDETDMDNVDPDAAEAAMKDAEEACNKGAKCATEESSLFEAAMMLI